MAETQASAVTLTCAGSAAEHIEHAGGAAGRLRPAAHIRTRAPQSKAGSSAARVPRTPRLAGAQAGKNMRF